MSKENCIAHHVAKVLLSNCGRFMFLLGTVKELLQRLDPLCFTYQHVDCPYTLFKYRVSGKSFVKSGQVLDNVQRAVVFTQRNRGTDKMSNIAKKRLSNKKCSKHLWNSSQKTFASQTSGLVSAKRIEQVRKTKSELEILKLVDCFVDGFARYSSTLVIFEMTSLQVYQFLLPEIFEKVKW